MNANRPPDNQKSSYWRFFLGASLVVLSLVALVAAFYAVENWRGNRLWKQYRAEVEARGLPVRPPRRAPEREVEASIACAKELQQLSPAFEWRYVDGLPYAPYGQFEDLAAWGRHVLAVKSGQTNQPPDRVQTSADAAARAAAAVVVLESLQGHEAYLEKLRSACRNPEPIYPFGYDHPYTASSFPAMPSIFDSINVCRYLKVKMTVELALGRSAEALSDFQLMLDLSNIHRSHEFMLAEIGRLACLNIALRPVLAGFAERRFTDAELRHLQKLIGSPDLISEFHRACLGERNLGLESLDWMQQTKYEKRDVDLVVSSAFTWLPAGWMQREKVNYARLFDSMLASAFTDGGKRIHLDALAQMQDRMVRDLKPKQALRVFLNHTVITCTMPPKLTEVAAACTSAQVNCDQIGLACGLERFYLKHAQYPSNLDQLIPEFASELPTDPLSGKGYQYAVDKNGRYRIWSVGPDETDDGGVQGQHPYSDRPGPGDWVWCYPG